MNKNIERIINLLDATKQSGTLCQVGQARLKWWRRNGKRFRSVKTALSTWTAEEIAAWFDFASIPYTQGSTRKARATWYAITDLADTIGLNESKYLPSSLRAPSKRLGKQAQACLERIQKANLLNRSERQLLGAAAFFSGLGAEGS